MERPALVKIHFPDFMGCLWGVLILFSSGVLILGTPNAHLLVVVPGQVGKRVTEKHQLDHTVLILWQNDMQKVDCLSDNPVSFSTCIFPGNF